MEGAVVIIPPPVTTKGMVPIKESEKDKVAKMPGFEGFCQYSKDWYAIFSKDTTSDDRATAQVAQ